MTHPKWVEKQSYYSSPSLMRFIDKTIFESHGPVVFESIEDEQTNIHFYLLDY